MTLIERLGPIARSIADAQVARKIRKDVPAIGDDAAGAFQAVVEAIAKAAEAVAHDADRAVGQVKHDASVARADIGSTAHDAFETVQAAAGDAASRVDDALHRLGKELPTDRLSGLVAAIERELPTPSKRRWSPTRTVVVGTGIVTTVAAGIAGALLLDPVEGPARRASLARSARSVGRQVRGKTAWTIDRAKGVAYERGILVAPAAAPLQSDAADPSPLIPVMDIEAMEIPATAESGVEDVLEVGDDQVRFEAPVALEDAAVTGSFDGGDGHGSDGQGEPSESQQDGDREAESLNR